MTRQSQTENDKSRKAFTETQTEDDIWRMTNRQKNSQETKRRETNTGKQLEKGRRQTEADKSSSELGSAAPGRTQSLQPQPLRLDW